VARRVAGTKTRGPVPQGNVGAALNAESAVEYAAERQEYARQCRKGASDRMKARYNRLANSSGFQESDRVWLYRPTRRRGSHLYCSHVGKASTTPYTDQRHSVPYSAGSPGKDDCGPPGQTVAMPGGYSRRMAVGRERCNEVSQRGFLARRLSPFIFVCWPLV
jgi:hypothetical protein